MMDLQTGFEVLFNGEFGTIIRVNGDCYTIEMQDGSKVRAYIEELS
jgi:ribosomal protein L21E